MENETIVLELTKQEAQMLRNIVGNIGLSKEVPMGDDLLILANLIEKVIDLPLENSTWQVEIHMRDQSWWDSDKVKELIERNNEHRGVSA